MEQVREPVSHRVSGLVSQTVSSFECFHCVSGNSGPQLASKAQASTLYFSWKPVHILQIIHTNNCSSFSRRAHCNLPGGQLVRYIPGRVCRENCQNLCLVFSVRPSAGTSQPVHDAQTAIMTVSLATTSKDISVKRWIYNWIRGKDTMGTMCCRWCLEGSVQ